MSEHSNPFFNSKPAKQLKINIDHEFQWMVLLKAPNNTRIRKFLQSSFIVLSSLTLNNQTDFKTLHLFRNGIS